MDQIINLLSQIEWPTLVLIAAMFWIFNGRQDRKFDQMDRKFDQMDRKFDKMDTRMDKLENKIDNLSHEVNDIKMRMYGIETVLHMKDCCILKGDQALKKAE